MIVPFLNFFRMRHDQLPPGPLPKSERRIITDMLESKDPTELIAALDSGHIKIVNKWGRDYQSTGGQIKICMDIYGPEVHIRGGELLDCNPHSYGLTSANGTRLYIAIMAAYGHKTSIDASEEMAYRHEEQIKMWAMQAELLVDAHRRNMIAMGVKGVSI